MSKTSSNRLRMMVVTAVMTAVICVLSPLSVPVGPVPISLATFAILLAVYLLGWKYGTIAVGLYLLIGLAGVPVFAGFQAGAARLVGPTGGYLIGYLPMALISGFFVSRFRGNLFLPVVGMVLETIVLYALGTAWMASQLEMTFSKALAAGVIPFIPGDIIKIVLVAVIGPVLYKALCSAGMMEAENSK